MIPPTTHEEVTPENIDRLLREAWNGAIDIAVDGMAENIRERLAEYVAKAEIEYYTKTTRE